MSSAAVHTLSPFGVNLTPRVHKAATLKDILGFNPKQDSPQAHEGAPQESEDTTYTPSTVHFEGIGEGDGRLLAGFRGRTIKFDSRGHKRL